MRNPLSPIVGALYVKQEPYPHLRDGNGCVLARDYEDEAKTDFIVRAVNSHDEMLAALTRTTQLLEAAGKAIEDADHIGFATDCENAVSTARAAISNATGAVK